MCDSPLVNVSALIAIVSSDAARAVGSCLAAGLDTAVSLVVGALRVHPSTATFWPCVVLTSVDIPS